jgi:hypothetical protein
MAYTPHFNEADDGGWWTGHYGERICEWTYDKREIRVTCPGREIGKMRIFTAEQTIDRDLLARVAIDLARQITGQAFDV